MFIGTLVHNVDGSFWHVILKLEITSISRWQLSELEHYSVLKRMADAVRTARMNFRHVMHERIQSQKGSE